VPPSDAPRPTPEDMGRNLASDYQRVNLSLEQIGRIIVRSEFSARALWELSQAGAAAIRRCIAAEADLAAAENLAAQFAAERDRLAAEVERLRAAGAQMANLCYNLRQMPERVPGDSDRHEMDTLWRQWDEASAAVTRAVKGKTG